MTALLRKDPLPATAHPAIVDARGRPLRDLRISLTDRCNLRCTYCMPAHAFGPGHRFMPTRDWLDFDEIAAVVRALADLGVRKVKLTGGEPLGRPAVPRLVAMLRAMAPALEVNLITNGVLLAPVVPELRDAGLDRLTISLDSLRPDRFAQISGHRARLDQVLAGIDAAVRAGFRPIKINMVVMRGQNDDEVADMARYFRRPETILRFIEYMDVGTVNGWRRDQVVSAAEILQHLRADAELVPVASAYRGETATRYRYADGSGEIGFIASVSQPFCGDCSRLRLSADGKLFTCLFATQGLDLRGILRREGPTALAKAVAGLWRERRDQYSVDRAERAAPERIEMFYIGG